MSINMVTGRDFEPLHREYATVQDDRSKVYKVTWYTVDNEMREHRTSSRMLAEHMAFANKGTFTTVKES